MAPIEAPLENAAPPSSLYRSRSPPSPPHADSISRSLAQFLFLNPGKPEPAFLSARRLRYDRPERNALDKRPPLPGFFFRFLRCLRKALKGRYRIPDRTVGNRVHRQLERTDPMKNVEMNVEGNTLTIKVDLSKEFGPSSSGKSIIIATTEGNVSVPGAEDNKVGLNVYRKT